MSPIQIDIPHDQIRAFCRKWRVTEFAVFGSVLREDFRPDSDIDVLLSFEEGAPWTLWDLIRMRAELQALFGRKVDVVEKRALRNPYRKQAILRTFEVLYAA